MVELIASRFSEYLSIIMKELVLTQIYSAFDDWLSQWNFVCKEGCSNCCTQNVTMIGLEGKRIQNFIEKSPQKEWFIEVLDNVSTVALPGSTTNEFAADCLKGEEGGEEELPAPNQLEPCPFLREQRCAVYPVRPFNCRCFVSQEKCGLNHPAVVQPFVLSASTALLQLIEHLDQGGQWGNMLDILRLRLEGGIDNQNILPRIQKCKPLPGFLIPPEDFDLVQPLIQAIFSSQVNDKTVETILNGG